MKLWGGRFTKEENQLVHNFNESLSFDQKFYKQDIQGSLAHVKMLGKQGIITTDEMNDIIKGLESIRVDLDNGTLQFDNSEDIHSFVEAHLIERIGDAGKKLHTGRSRNDQVALDMKLYTRHEVEEINDLLKTLLNSLLKVMEENTETFMPGFTHLQKAQPITLAHHFGAYFEMFKRDRSRLDDIHKRMNLCPLGSGALAGTTYPLDREYTANLLGFDGPTLNSMDSVSDRDYLIEFLSALSTIMMHLSRFCEEICIWNSNEYRFVNIDDSYSTGSSIMPQKKNPDMAELIRGKSGRVYGNLIGLLTVMKSLPLAYNKDLQEDKEGMFDTVETITVAIDILAGMLNTMTVNDKHMAESTEKDFSNATELADYLATKGLPFREAHEIVGKLVLECTKAGYYLQDVPLERYQEVSDLIEEDIYETLKSHTAVERRHSLGGTGFDQVKWQIKEAQQSLNK